ncbi:MAG TPA: thiamine pyrophosphate-dependent enzyme [Chloroflexota bacterium]|nr:thiamine pyrophosphate-dependent enzyme [Chloroflexota bacterium]
MQSAPTRDGASTAQPMTGGEALAQQLAREGVRDIFGVPGVQLDYAVDGLAKLADRITYWNTRHEQATAYMADGYARTTGDIGVCMVVPGPGLLNALAGVATAYACSSRVLCIAGQIPSNTIGRGLGMLHEIPDQSRILGALTKWSGQAGSPAEVPGLVHEAVRQLRSGRHQPVGIEVPPDVLQALGEVALLAPVDHDEPLEPDPDLVRRAAEWLARAERPVLYVGGGVVAGGASEALKSVAERLEAPVVMSPNGRGALDDRHPLALTSLAGRQLLGDADLVLAIGTRFLNGQAQLALAPGARLVLLNVEARDLGDPRKPDLAIHGDAGLGLVGLREQLDGLAPRPSRRAELESRRVWAEGVLAQIEPQYSWVRALRAAVPEDGILVNEFTQVGYVAQTAYPVYQPRSYVSPGYQGTLGYGFPTALGARVGNPERAVLSITGDGGFGWGLAELSTARKYGIGLVTVVFNDGAYGNVRRSQVEQFEGRLLGTDLVNPDFVQLAESFGVRGARATTPAELQGLLRETLGGQDAEPVVIDVPVPAMPNPFQSLRMTAPARPSAAR